MLHALASVCPAGQIDDKRLHEGTLAEVGQSHITRTYPQAHWSERSAMRQSDYEHFDGTVSECEF